MAIETLDHKALQAAHATFVGLLHTEAELQGAYVAAWPDGCISLELEGVNFEVMIRAAVMAYLSGIAENATTAQTERGPSDLETGPGDE